MMIPQASLSRLQLHHVGRGNNTLISFNHYASVGCYCIYEQEIIQI